MNNSFEVVAEISQNELPTELSGMNAYNLNYNAYLGENCNIVSFNGYYYTFQNQSMIAVTLPSNYYWNKFHSPSLNYLIINSQLHRYNHLSNSYEIAYNLSS